MLFFIDTANLDEIREANPQSLVTGVMTKPSLLAKEQGGSWDILEAICKEVPGPVSAEVMAQKCEEIVEEGRSLASIRHPLHVVEAALAGADIATIPFNVLAKLLHHPLTDVGLERFLEDWKRSRGGATS